MDDEKWKNLLLNWIDLTGLLPTGDASLKVACIEDTDIRRFYKQYLDLLNIPDSRPVHIPDFLKVNYPDFELISSGLVPHENDVPPRRDYILIYSIFLHYGCITCLDKTVQGTSQSLCAGEQLAVSVFLNHFLSRNTLVTRTAITRAIRDAVQSMDAGPLAKFYAEDENGNRGGGGESTFTTPKTVRLEQNSREIYRLRGQVDTVDFEKSYLEGLVHEKELQIVNLKQREGDLMREAEEMKRNLLFGGSLMDDERRAAEEEVARKERQELRMLRKSNAMLEDKVSNLLIEVNNVTNDKLKLVGKLKIGAKEIKAYRERESELAVLIEELNGELAAKNRRIGELLEVNMELESYITENKSLWSRNIDTMNTSSLSTYSAGGTTGPGDTSAHDSSSSLLRSANLGSCIIDIQLKEKELENAELKAQLESLHDKSVGMKEGMERFLEENAAFREKCSGGCGAAYDGAWPEKIPEFFQSLTEALKEKARLESTVEGQISVILCFREERDRLKDELGVQVEKSAAMERELSGLRETVKTYAEAERRELDTFKYEVKHLNDLMTVQKLEKESFKTAIEKGEGDIYAKNRRITKLNLVIEKLRYEKKKSDSEHAEKEASLTRLWDTKLEEAKGRIGELERRLAETENVLAMRQKHVELVEEARDQLATRNEELRVGKEEAEKKALEREEMQKKETIRLKDLVERLEKESVELKRDNANLGTKVQIMGNSLRTTLEMDKGKLDSDSARARRSSLLNQMTSTPRLSMKQKVRLDMELMKRRRISLLSPDDEITSSESDNNAVAGAGDPCICKLPLQQLQRQANKAKVARRDSLLFNSPGKKKRSTFTQNPSKAHYDRTAISQWQKQKRQKVFNKQREVPRESEPGTGGGGGGACSTQLDSLLWDGEFDLMDLEGPAQDFGTNNEQMQRNFQAVLQMERCDGEDLFKGQQQPQRQQQPETNSEGNRTDEDEDHEQDDQDILPRTEISIERRADDEAGGEGLNLEPQLVRSSFEKSGASTIQSKSYSMNSGVYWGSERIPTASVVHLSPRSDGGSPQQRKSRMWRVARSKWDLNVIPLSQQNLLQLIANVLMGILLCVVYQSLAY